MANLPRSRFLLIILAFVALVAVGCGGSDSSDTDADTAGADTSDADTADDAEDDDAPAGGGDDEPAETSSTTTTTTSTTTTTAPVSDDPRVAAYCVAAAEADAFSDSLTDFSPESVEAWATENVALLDAAIPDAPEAIQDDLRTLRRSLDEFLVVLEANGWDLFAAADELEALSELPGPAAAEERLDAWEAENCADVDVPEPDGDTTFEDAFTSPEAFEAILGSEAGRQLMIEGMTEDGTLDEEQAACLLDNLDFETLAALAQGGDPTPEMLGQFLELIDTCDLASLIGG